MRRVRLSEQRLIDYLLKEVPSMQSWGPRTIAEDSWIDVPDSTRRPWLNVDFRLEFQGRNGIKLGEHKCNSICIPVLPDLLGAEVHLSYFPSISTLYSLSMWGGMSTRDVFLSSDYHRVATEINQSLAKYTAHVFHASAYGFVRMVRVPNQLFFSFLSYAPLASTDDWMREDNTLAIRDRDLAVDCVWEGSRLVYVDGSLAV